jgi:hypothetical protein
MLFVHSSTPSSFSVWSQGERVAMRKRFRRIFGVNSFHPVATKWSIIADTKGPSLQHHREVLFGDSDPLRITRRVTAHQAIGRVGVTYERHLSAILSDATQNADVRG